MRHFHPHPFVLALVAVICTLITAPAAFAQYDLSWNTIDGGGDASAGGAFTLIGTIGQPDASGALAGGAFTLTGGFWPGALPTVSCPADISPPGGNHSVNVDDLLAVITNWGACPVPCPPRCPADIAPVSTGNCAVNVDDLLLVITNWGPCP